MAIIGLEAQQTPAQAIQTLLKPESRGTKLQAGEVLRQHALEVMERPRLRRRFAQSALPALMHEVLKLQGKGSRQVEIIEQNLETIALLGKESINLLEVLVRIYLETGRRGAGSKWTTLKTALGYTIERIYDDAYAELILRLHRGRPGIRQRAEMVKHLESFLLYWAFGVKLEKEYRKIAAELLYIVDNDPSSTVVASAINSLVFMGGTDAWQGDSRLRTNVVFTLIRTLQDNRQLKIRQKTKNLGAVAESVLSRLADSMLDDLEKLLRFYNAEKKLFSSAENRVIFLAYLGRVIDSDGKRKHPSTLGHAVGRRALNKLAQLQKTESNPKVQRRLKTLVSNISRMVSAGKDVEQAANTSEYPVKAAIHNNSVRRRRG